jgi:hypothetical protein
VWEVVGVPPRRSAAPGTEASMATLRTESPVRDERGRAERVSREHLTSALPRVQANHGSAGIEGMTVGELAPYLPPQWPSIRAQWRRGR